ncbi:MAG: 4Fe-4S binding protein [Gracilibacteraceae bacterium]|nr:4Fe-4S binding protein [Gracilibacteraceae bacterium]
MRKFSNFRHHHHHHHHPNSFWHNLSAYTIDAAQCTRCGLCQKVCPAEAVTGERETGFSIDRARCGHCGLCAARCRAGAIGRKIGWDGLKTGKERA